MADERRRLVDLYDVLDRLVHAEIDERGAPEHRWSRLGAALHKLHEMSDLAAGNCVCATLFNKPED